MITQEDLETLKQKLPRGYSIAIQKRSGFSLSLVNKFFQGKVYNLAIHKAAVDYAAEYKKAVDGLIERTQLV